MALVDYFLKIDGIEGESTDAKHKGEIPLESFSWAAQNAGTVNEKGGQVSFTDFSFTSKVGTQSPQLFEGLLRSNHFPTATLTARKRETGGVEIVVVLSDVLVSSYKENAELPAVQCDGDGQQNRQQNNVAMESVSLNFLKLEFLKSSET